MIWGPPYLKWRRSGSGKEFSAKVTGFFKQSKLQKSLLKFDGVENGFDGGVAGEKGIDAVCEEFGGLFDGSADEGSRL